MSDYYPGGAPMPGRTLEALSCTTTTTHNVNFGSLGNNGYTAMTYSTIANTGGVLVVSKNSTLTTPVTWGTRMQAYTLTAGTVYTLDYTFAWGSCSATPLAYGIRVVNAGTSVVEFNTVSALSGANSVQFAVSTGGSYYVEFYVLSTGNKACSFSIDNVLYTYVTSYTSTTNCTTGTALQYAWGHNGQLKDNEIYGKGNAYSAEYWEYDARLLRRWNTDPIEYSSQSTYACFNDNPIFYADPQGLEGTNDTGGDDCDCDTPPCPNSQKEIKDPLGVATPVGDNAEVSADAEIITYPNGTRMVFDYDLKKYITPEAPKDGSIKAWEYRHLDPALYDRLMREYYRMHPAGAPVKYPEYRNGVGYLMFGELMSGRYLSTKENPYIWTAEENREASMFMLELLTAEIAVPVAGVIWTTRGIKLVKYLYLAKYGKNAKNIKTALTFNKGVSENFIKHAFAKGRHADLGLSIEVMASKGLKLVENNISLLKAGDNTLIGNINGIQKSFKVFVQDGKIMTVNMYPGVSNRVTQGTVIDYGSIVW